MRLFNISCRSIGLCWGPSEHSCKIYRHGPLRLVCFQPTSQSNPQKTKQMLHVWMKNTIVLLEGALVTSTEDDRLLVSTMKGLEVNLDALP